jgi:hypothetical protein
MEKRMLQKLAEARCEPNDDQVRQKKKSIKAQAAKKSFIEEMLQPVALAVTSIVSQGLQCLAMPYQIPCTPLHSQESSWWQTRPGSCLSFFFQHVSACLAKMPDGCSKASAQMKRKHEAEEKKYQDRLKKRRATLVSLDQNLKNKKWVAAEDCKVFSPQAEERAVWCNEAGDPLSEQLMVKYKGIAAFCRTAPQKMKFWKVSTLEPFETESWQDAITQRGLLMEDVGLLGAVLFGGYLVDEAWIAKSKPLLAKELVLEPLWKLRGSAVCRKQEVWFDFDTVDAESQIMKAHIAVPAAPQ